MCDDQVIDLVERALKENVPAREILEHGLIPGMKEVGDRFKKKEYYVPEVLLASEAFYAGFNMIKPLLKADTTRQRGKIVIGVVHGDIHDIGKNIVKVLVEAAGFHVIDLGKDVPLERFVAAVRDEQPDILALSSLMTTSMLKMKEIIRTLEQQRLRTRLKVIIGGAPVTGEFAQNINADAYGEDAADAVTTIENLLSG
ncbi:corrinoid protein [candidate division WOR-3 bacterium]|nr:corrinoid protein [candidate division WOR-3 bacterium]